MKRVRLRWSRPGIPVNVPLFFVGLALILGPTVGVEVGGVKVPVLGSWWIGGPLVAGGVVIMALSFFTTEPPPAPPGKRRPLPPLPPLVPGTAFFGDVPDLPTRFVARADVFDAVRDDVVSHATVALVGMGGAGKTIAATAIAHDPAVQTAFFRGGIAWVDAGQQATPTQLQERLAARLTNEATVSFPTAEVGRHRLAELIAGRAFLLVIDDVWDAEALSALSVVGAPRGALLFTTRDRGIARAVGATVREVDELTLEQALALLASWTDTDFDQLPPVADALCLRVGNLALGVALVGGMVKSRGAQPRDWQEVMRRLDTADIKAIADAYGPDHYKHASVLASITVSIDDLPPVDQDRYRELAVFAGRGSVPPTAVSALWASAGCSAGDTEGLLVRLTDRSLAQRDNRGWITLHDLQYDVAAHQLAASPGGLALAHGRLLDGYRSQCPQAVSVPSASAKDDRSVWVRGPDDGYFFQNLAFHLARAGRSQQLDRLLVNFAWLERKLAVAGISDLLADYSHQQPRPSHVDAVHGALQLSAHVLARDPNLLASQLVGRLLGQSAPSISALVDAARPSDGHPWLCPRTPGSLTEPGGPLERTLEGHADAVAAVAVTADGQHIVSGGDDGTVRVWDLASGRLERTLEGHSSWVHAVAVTADGQRIVSGSGDSTVRVWNLASGRLERTLEGHADGVRAVAVTADGQHIVSGGDRTVRVWDLASGRLERTLRHGVQAVAVTADGQHIVSGSMGGRWIRDFTVRVWDLASGRLERTLEGHSGGVLAVAVTADGQHIVSGSGDGTVRVWDLASGRLERTLEGHAGTVGAVAVTADGQHIVSGGDDGTVRVWDLASGRPERTLEGHAGTVRAVAVTADGQHIVSGGNDGTVRVWNLASGHPERTLEGHAGPVRAVAVTADGQHIVSGGNDGTVRVWDLASGHPERTLEGHAGPVRAVAVTADGQHIVSGGDDGTVRVWDLASGRPECTLEGHPGPVLAVAVTADGQHIVSGSDDFTVRVWDPASGRLERTLEGHSRPGVEAVAVTADGQHIVSGGSDSTVRVWDPATGRLERTLEGPRRWVEAVAVTADGQHIVSGGEGAVRVWDLASGRLERTMEGHSRWVEAVAVTADGQRIVSGSGDSTVRVWDLASGTELARWVADANVASCAGHPRDPTALVYGDSDGRVVVLWLRSHGHD